MSTHDEVLGGQPEAAVAVTGETSGKGARPITPRVLARIEQNVRLMRWSEGVDDFNGKPIEGVLVVGSLGDVFWNTDIPRLIAAARREVVKQSPTDTRTPEAASDV